MPDPNRLLRTLRQALSAFKATSGRRGRVVRLESCDEVLATGDLHGNLENFRRLLLIADLGNHPRRHFILQELVHGPRRYTDGTDKSHQLIDLLAALKCQYPQQVHMLLGNHELAQWQDRLIAKTAQADLDLTDLFRRGVASAYGPRGPELYETYRELFSLLPVAIRTPNRIFLSHSMPGKNRIEVFDAAILEQDHVSQCELIFRGSIHSLVWGRDTSQTTVESFLRKVDADLLITGHIPCDQAFDTPNDRQLILDSMGSPGAYCLFPTACPLTQAELKGFVKLF